MGGEENKKKEAYKRYQTPGYVINVLPNKFSRRLVLLTPPSEQSHTAAARKKKFSGGGKAINK